MIDILFKYESQTITIQGNIENKMKEIAIKFKTKINKDNNDFYYVYNGNKIDEELTLNEIINQTHLDNIIILAFNSNTQETENEKKIEESKEIICPTCKLNVLINIRDYQINLYGCKNGHKKDNILLKEFENGQKVDYSKIICCLCENNRSNTFKNNFYTCNNCGKNFCPICKTKHDRSHTIINYDDKNYICKKHNDKYMEYCKECKENICFLCKGEHSKHDIMELGNIIPNKDELLKGMKNMRELINKFKNEKEEINNIFNKITNHLEEYYTIFNKIINNSDFNIRNYENYYNLNEIKNSNNIIINDLKYITNETNIANKLNKIIDIYYKIIRTKEEKIYENGDKYIGELVNNLKHGEGILYYNKDSVFNRYEGFFKNDKREGKGVLYLKNGDKYKGDFKDDKCEGKGKYYIENGNKCKGDFKNNKLIGKGIYYWKNGDRYEGEFKDNKREGKGKIFYIDGDIYEGHFKDNIYDGKGIYYWKDGRRYEGDWKNGKKEGKGIFYYNTGDRYEGDWKNDKREGDGIVYYNNGDREMGKFLDGQNLGIFVKYDLDGHVTQQQY